MKKGQKEFDIEVFRLGNKKHEFEYELNDSFFELFDDSFLKKGKLKVLVTLDKSERHIIGNFKINGIVELTCDRSLENFDFNIETEDNLIFKFGDEFMELSEDVIQVPRDIQKLNLAQYIYEFIGLSIPIKKLHPKYKAEEEREETELIYKTETDESVEDDEKPSDPRWEALNKLKNNLN